MRVLVVSGVLRTGLTGVGDLQLFADTGTRRRESIERDYPGDREMEATDILQDRELSQYHILCAVDAAVSVYYFLGSG